jgi:hypothetical protein
LIYDSLRRNVDTWSEGVEKWREQNKSQESEGLGEENARLKRELEKTANKGSRERSEQAETHTDL